MSFSVSFPIAAEPPIMRSSHLGLWLENLQSGLVPSPVRLKLLACTRQSYGMNLRLSSKVVNAARKIMKISLCSTASFFSSRSVKASPKQRVKTKKNF
jgi:hypothetical protein